METIIGLLFILLPVIMKLIGKRLEQSGKAESAAKMRKIAQSLGGDEGDGDEEPLSGWIGGTEAAEPVMESVEETVVPPVVVPAAKPVMPQKYVQPVRKSRPMLLEEDKKKAGREKIDPKKLVIYSEIMQPKYKDN